MQSRTVTQDDINAAARGLKMVALAPDDLINLIAQHQNNLLFASKVITAAAKQMLTAKRRMGAAPARN